MKMPGFSAEASICKSEAYRFVSMDVEEGETVPAEYVVGAKGSRIPSGSLPKIGTRNCCRRFEISCHEICEERNGLISCDYVCGPTYSDCRRVSNAFRCPSGYNYEPGDLILPIIR